MYGLTWTIISYIPGGLHVKNQHAILIYDLLSGKSIWLCLWLLTVLRAFWVYLLGCNPAAAAAAKSLQSCPTLSDPMDCSLPGSSVHGIFQARVLEWVPLPSPVILSLAQIKFPFLLSLTVNWVFVKQQSWLMDRDKTESESPGEEGWHHQLLGRIPFSRAGFGPENLHF